MQRFKQFIAENATGYDLSQVHALFAVPGTAFGPKRQERAKAALAKLEAALAAKSIYNADFNDMKDDLNRAYEAVEEDLRKKEWYPALQAAGPQWIDNGSARGEEWWALHDKFQDYGSGLQGAKKSLKNWSQGRDKFPGLIRHAEAGLALKAALEAVKPFIIKGRPPKPVDPNKFVKPAADYNVQKEVFAFLETVIADARKELTDSTVAQYMRDLERAKALNPMTSSDFGKLQGNAQFLASRIWTTTGYKKPMKLADDAEKIALKWAHERVEQILGEFLHKNKEKLSLLVQKKGGMTAHKIIANRVSNGSLENIMYFEFGDKSSFRIYSKVEGAYSPRGLYFLRMPTRFTDVKLANGQKMSQPSEEKMITSF